MNQAEIDTQNVEKQVRSQMNQLRFILDKREKEIIFKL